MFAKKINPTTPGQRFRVAVLTPGLSKNKPERSLLVSMKSSGGRNNTGKMTVRNRGGGHKKRVRLIDMYRCKYDVPGIINSIEYDPMRTAHIALVHYVDGDKAYIIAPEGIKEGDKIMSGENASPDIGNALPMRCMPVGTTIHNIELHPGRGAAMARSAGSHAQLLSKADKYVTLKLPSGERRMVLANCMATVGRVSNPNHMDEMIGKAGRNRWLGKRPRVRCVAMNPVDHPMGGGEGKASGGHPRSRTGLLAKGKRTRNIKKYSQHLIISRRVK
jgi:large subunit ribosomal protein L2